MSRVNKSSDATARQTHVLPGPFGFALALVLGAAALLWVLRHADQAPPLAQVRSSDLADQAAGQGASVAGDVVPLYPHIVCVGQITPPEGTGPVQLCQGCGPDGRPFCGVDCGDGNCCAGEPRWNNSSLIDWEQFAQGEYIGPPRTSHVMEYRLRVDDQLQFVYRLTRDESSQPYQLNVGDTIRVESLTDNNLDRELIIQPDGTITLRLLGQVKASRLTVEQLRQQLEERYKQFYKVPAITVTPLLVNTKLDDLRNSVDSRAGAGGQGISVRITPEGTIQLPALGSVPAQGLTLSELKREVDQRYAREVQGIEVTPLLSQRAPRYVYVLGEVQTPGRFELSGPTTVMQSIALAGGWVNSGNLRHIVVFRRGEDWRLLATRLDLRGALLGKRPCPADEIWLRDSDLVIVPKMPIAVTNDFIELVFTRGVYGVVPFQGASVSFAKLSSI